MTHPASGNTLWQDFPDTSTPVSAARLEAMESAIDQTLSGGWLSLTMSGGWQGRDAAQGTSSFYAPASRQLPGGRIEVVGTIFRSSGGAASGDTLATLATAHRPSRETLMVATDSAGYAVPIIVRTTGVLAVSSFRTTATTISFSGSFVLSGPT